jgi:RimJ/RimL family protein N-acetyltransferase
MFRGLLTNSNAHFFTKRLCLRLLKPSDAADIARLLQDDSEAVQMTASMIDPMTEEAARDWIDRRSGSGQHVFAILLKSSGEFMGSIGIGMATDAPFVGYWIGRPYWNQGYATEALHGLIEYARWLGLSTLHADTFPNNPASGRVLAKVGFVNTGRIHLNLPLRGGLRESEHYVLKLF